MGVTQTLARFVALTEAEVIPPEAVTEAKRAILDTLGVALAGCREESSGIVAEWVRQQGGVEEAGVWGHGFRTAAPQAALANGASGHALDYDDVNVSMRGHPSVPLVPALLALGEKTRPSGQEFIAAFVLGFEVETKLGRLAGGAHYALGWHATSTLGTLGAAAGCARLLRLDEGRTHMALAVAASMASGLRENFGTMTKPLHAGLAARNGLAAAELAARGFTASQQALEGNSGFLPAFTGAKVDSPSIEGLGDPFDIVSPGIGVKLYPCCYVTHRALDAALELRATNGIDASQVEAVEVRVNRGMLMPLIKGTPRTGLEGKFSLEYCLAAALLDGWLTLDSFTDTAVRRPEAQALLAKVRAVEEEEEAPFPIGGYADVRIRMMEGGEHSLRVDVPKGDPQRPLTWEELAAKFRDCARRALPAEAVERIVELVGGLEGVRDVRELASVITAA
ncbi:MAG: MmgE/PrpD family protein [Chloroflexi bacterium]|nr:MmgE/PrpD family protein [Chloroflexota bacterium]